ncbi:hypothetical protein D3C81_1947520 [compost metagenome]
MAGDVVVNENRDQSNEDNAIDTTTGQQGNSKQSRAITAGHDELIVDGKRQQRQDKKNQHQVRDSHESLTL